MALKLDAKIPAGALAEKWSNHKTAIKVVSPANKRKLDIIIVGTGLGGASAAASLGELGYNVKVFCIQDSPRRAHSIAAQGGINAAKNYQNDNDSVYRLFYDTIKGGDYRAREANVYRLAEVSNLHHRPVRRPGRSLRPRVRRPAGQPFVRRRAGFAYVLRPRPDGPAAPAGRLCGSQQGDRSRHGEELPAPRDAGHRHRGRRGQGHHRPQPRDGRDRTPRRTRRRDRHGRLRQRLLPVDQRYGVERLGRIPVLPQGRRLRQPLLHADPPHLHPRARRPAVEADADVGVAA